jgi:uncharacterized membrane protein affecting hemolysin expression
MDNIDLNGQEGVRGRFGFQRILLSMCLTTEQHRLKRTVRAILGRVIMSFYSLLIIAPLVTKRYEEVLVVHVFQFTKV